LERWEQDSTERIIEWLESKADALERLRALFGAAIERENDLRIELALLAASDLPQVAAAVHRVTERRMDYMTSLYEGVGFPADAARRRAVLTYSVYLGQAQLRRSSPASLPKSAKEMRTMVDDALRGLLAP
jgi:hypothetical protein